MKKIIFLHKSQVVHIHPLPSTAYTCFIFFAQLDLSVLNHFSPSPNVVSRETLWVYGLKER